MIAVEETNDQETTMCRMRQVAGQEVIKRQLPIVLSECSPGSAVWRLHMGDSLEAWPDPGQA